MSFKLHSYKYSLPNPYILLAIKLLRNSPSHKTQCYFKKLFTANYKKFLKIQKYVNHKLILKICFQILILCEKTGELP